LGFGQRPLNRTHRSERRFIAKAAFAIAFALAASVAATANAQSPGKWVNISDSVIAQLTKEGKKIGWPGQTSGVGVDRTNGDVYMVVCDNGLWKSTDHGATFARIDGGAVTGRCETGFGLDFSEHGRKFACATVYGNSATAFNSGERWLKSTLGHLDCVAASWRFESDVKDTARDTALLSIKHENGGELVLSRDAGKTWDTLGKGFNGVGLFGAALLVGFKDGGIVRSTDFGKTWNQVSDLKPTGKAMRVFNGVGYWVGSKGLLVSRDKGESWSQLGSPVECSLGPYFGKTERDIVVMGKRGIMKTTDAGQTWSLAAPLPPDVDGGTMSQCGWDPINDIYYAGRMGKPTYKFEAGK